MQMLRDVADSLARVAGDSQRAAEELGGFVLISVLTSVADGYRPLCNLAPSLRDRRLIFDGAEVMSLLAEESPRGRVLAPFHTHPSDPAVISDGDREVFLRTGSKFAFIHGRDGLKCFRRLPGTDLFADEPIEVIDA